jgi:transposase
VCSDGYFAMIRIPGRDPMVSADIVDALGLLVVVLVTAASMQDRDGGRLVLTRARMAMPSIVLVWADGGYAGRCVAFVRQFLRITLQIVRKPAGQRTFEVLPRRWVVERSLPWLVRCRRLNRDYERLPEHAEAMIKWIMIGLMTRRLAPATGRHPWQPPEQPDPFPNTLLALDIP